jgi:hypothetical protein
MPIVKYYKIISGDMLPYVGSTILKRGLPRRLTYHRASKRKWVQGKERYMSSFDLLNGNESIELLEDYEYSDRKDLLGREQYWIDKIPNRNKYNAQGHKDRKEYFANYRAEHKDKAHTDYLEKYKTEQIRKTKIKREMLRMLKNYNV